MRDDIKSLLYIITHCSNLLKAHFELFILFKYLRIFVNQLCTYFSGKYLKFLFIRCDVCNPETEETETSREAKTTWTEQVG